MKHILITGTGRAGTTLLVQVLTALGFDTGYALDEALASIDPIARAGLEPNLRKARLAQVVKAPGQADRIGQLLATEGFELEAAIVPIRDLFAAAESRRNVYDLAHAAGKDPLKHPGSLWRTSDPSEQEAKLAIEFYRCLQLVVATGAPVHLIEFPRFALDPEYFGRSLGPLFQTHGITSERAARAMADVAKPELINTFTGSKLRNPHQPSAGTPPARGFWSRFGR